MADQIDIFGIQITFNWPKRKADLPIPTAGPPRLVGLHRYE